MTVWVITAFVAGLMIGGCVGFLAFAMCKMSAGDKNE
jgi:hypothetical protein